MSSPSNGILRRWIGPACLSFVLVVSAAARFSNLAAGGISPSDPCFYWNIAAQWAGGDYSIPPEEGFIFLRPVHFAVDALALRLFGINDYAIKFVHAAMDLLNIVLIYLLGIRISRSPPAALGAAMLYATSPIALIRARTEFGHIPATTFVLLACLPLFAAAERLQNSRKALPLMFLSGVFFGMALGIRTETIFFVPGLLLALGFFTNRFLDEKRAFAAAVSAFTVGILLLPLVIILVYGWNFVVDSITVDAQFKPKNESVPPWLFAAQLFAVGPERLFSQATAFAFLLSLIVIPIRRRHNSNWLLAVLPLCTLLSFCLTFPLLVSRNDVLTRLPRALLPLAPFIALQIAVWIFELIKGISPKSLSTALFFSVTVGLCGNEFSDTAMRLAASRASPFRNLYDMIGHSVTSDAKVLIAPSTHSTSHRCYRTGVYFGANAVYLSDLLTPDRTLEQLAAEQQIRYLFLSHRLLRSETKAPPNLARALGWTDESYTLEREETSLRQIAVALGGRLIYRDEYYGELFDFDPK